MVKGVSNITFWPGVAPVLGAQAGDGRSIVPQNLLDFFQLVSQVVPAVGNAGKGGREQHKCAKKRK